MPFVFKPDGTLPEVIHVQARKCGDARGWFAETYREHAFREGGVAASFVQDNHARSEERGTVRGLHFQTGEHAQAKLVRCLRGRILDVAVDIRPESPRFGMFTSVELSEGDGRQLYVPVGFAHGYCTLDEGTEVAYKTSTYYAPQAEGGIAHDDPAIGIDWRVPPADRILSDKDRALPTLSDYRTMLEQMEPEAQ